MVLWGAIWGAILGLLTSRHDPFWNLVIGAGLGALAGRMLRNEVRKEAERAAQQYLATTSPVKRVEHVEQEAAVAQQAPIPTIPTPIPAPAAPPPAAETVVTDDVPELPVPPPMPTGLERMFEQARNWLFGGNTIVRMGVLVLFVGLAFLAKYAIDNALLPPELRLAAIGAVGIALFVFGHKLHARQADQGNQGHGQHGTYALTLQGAGVAVLYLTVFAAFRLYQLLPAGAAFAVLGLVCAFSTAVALLQNAHILAFVGFAGAFAAPVLVSTGQGDHVGLFSYYLLLGIAIMGIAWLRAWRALNLLGFFATFGVATLWGVLKYQPEHLASTEPFLLAFFALYLSASLLYATRHGLAPRQAVDATLIFGTPLVAFGLQVALMRDIAYASAFSALALGGLYLALGWWALRRSEREQGQGVSQWLAECFAALGLGFVTLAVPLALDARWTTAVWAAEGAAVYWMGQRQERWLARLAGLVLQVLAALSYLNAGSQLHVAALPLVNPGFIGALLLSASALALAHWSRSAAAGVDASAWVQQFSRLELELSPVLFWVGFLWWQFALHLEITRMQPDLDGLWVPVIGHTLQVYLKMLGWLGSAWLAHHLARPERPNSWSIAATPAWFSLPIMVLIALRSMFDLQHVFQSWGWLVWPLALSLHFATLRRLDTLAPQRWWAWVHSAGVWLLVLLVGNLLLWAVRQAQLQGTAWAGVILLVASVLVLLALTARALYNADSPVRTRWPLQRFAMAYLWRAAVPLTLAVACGALLVALRSNGNAHPLPYVPLLNPTDLTIALALAACSLWLLRIRQSDLPVPPLVHHARWPLVLAGLVFIALNTAWLRVAHHYADVPWNASRLFDSFLVQAGYSILWTLLALGLMLLAHRRQVRMLWTTGAALLGLTLAKLFLIDLSNRGGSERIVAFIAVGVLMLVVGYFAPIPPAVPAENSDGKAA
ncbi:MAG: DUF2339 domain-containing protein [Rhodoferax sp.]|nr:DUF2339 domain-containing protein [Rhodoferax sp.]